MAFGEHLAKAYGNSGFMKEEEIFKDVKIKDIPIMMAEDGSICCIPARDEVSAIGICGLSGYGKSLMLNLIHSHLFYNLKCNVAIMNDVSEETFKWSEPMKNNIFNQTNEFQLGLKPIGSPIVHVYPNTNTLEINTQSLGNTYKSYVKTVLPFSEIVENIGFYLEGVNPEFELGKSGMYINDLKEDLIECETTSQVRDILKEKLPGSDGKSFQSMRIKIMTAFDSLFSEEILDITNPECHPYLQIKNPSYISNPFSVLMKAGRIPSFVTSDLVNKKYKSQVFAHYIREIFETMPKDFPKDKTYLLFDELRDVCTKDDEPATKELARVAARGRIKNVGLVYCTQFYNMIPKSVRGAKLNYLIVFKHGNESIANEIKKDFNLSKHVKERILNLKKFQCIAVTQNHFVFYRNGERWIDSAPVSGMMLYPLANHRKA